MPFYFNKFESKHGICQFHCLMQHNVTPGFLIPTIRLFLNSNSTISILTSKPIITIMWRVYGISLGYLLFYQCNTASYSLINPPIGDETVPLKSYNVVPSHAPRLLRAQDGFVLPIISDSDNVASHSCQLTVLRLRKYQYSCQWVLPYWYSTL
jgi:hypothetical protein